MRPNNWLAPVLMLGVVCLGWLGLQAFKWRMSDEVRDYLLKERHYRPEQVARIYTQIGKAPVVSTTVIFADEPSTRYFYRKLEGTFLQYSIAPLHGADYSPPYKHEEPHRIPKGDWP